MFVYAKQIRGHSFYANKEGTHVCNGRQVILELTPKLFVLGSVNTFLRLYVSGIIISL